MSVISQHIHPTFQPTPLALGVTLALGLGLTIFTPTQAYAQNDENAAEAVQELALTRVEQAKQNTATTLAPLDMRMILRSDLSESLSILPSVRVADTASSSTRQADLRPAEFSIRGAAPYQNNIRLDNASIDSFLDPANRVLPGGNPERSSVAGHSQALFIDPAFLQQLEIIDRNASASEGGFTGGVLRATTRGYQGQNSVNLSYRTTRDNWTQFHIDERQLSNFEEGAAQRVTGTPNEFQPDFDKHELSLSGATRVGQVGIFAGVSERRASTTQKRTAEIAALSDMNYFLETGHAFKPGTETELNNYSRYYTLRADILDVPYDLYATLSYSDFQEESFLINFLESDFSSEVRGLNLAVNYGNDFGATRLDANVAVGRSNNRRDALLNTQDNFRGRNFYSQVAFIGGFGSLENQQNTVSSRIDLSTPINQQLHFNYGGEIRHAKLEQQRAEDYIETAYNPPTPAQLNGLQGAVPYEDHILDRRVTYLAGDISFDTTNYDAYAEFDGELNQFYYRAGVRAGRDDWLANTNFAPRLMAGYYFGGDQDFNLEVGANRYYGKSFLSYRLNELARRNIRIEQSTNPYDPNATIVESSAADEWESNDLDTPYDNEYSISLTTHRWQGVLGTSVTRREGKQQIRTQTNPETGLKRFANSGQSETTQFDLFWRSPTYQWAASNWRVNSSLSWMDKETDAQLLSGGYLSGSDPLRDVLLGGQVISAFELPAADFALPFKAQIDITTLALNDRLLVRNAFSFSDGFEFLRRMALLNK